MKQQNISLDILKFIAVIFIINSHAELCYPQYKGLATGGAIGNVLFLFCSGFTIFLGRMDRFDNWYKRRINRIYPSVFAFLLYVMVVLSESINANSLIFRGGWFVYCIMIYYVFLYLIKCYMDSRLNWAFVLVCVLVVVWYLFEDKSTVFMYKVHLYNFSKCFYFLFMLFGAIIGSSKKVFNYKLLPDMLKLVGSVVLYYGFLFLCTKNQNICQVQILSLIPLLSITYYFYKVCNAPQILKLAQKKIASWVIGIVATLTLEIYLVQFSLFTDKMNAIFPLNLPIMFVIIVAVAYLVKVVSRIFSQTFSENKYDWWAVFRLEKI